MSWLLNLLSLYPRYFVIGLSSVLLGTAGTFSLFLPTFQSAETARSNSALVASNNATETAQIQIATKSATPPKPAAAPAKTAPKPAAPKTETPAPAPAPSTPVNNRLGFANNKMGMYSYKDPESIRLTSEMVNSNGGDWGWILFPINIKDRGTDGWNSIFSICSENHLIPILQLIMDPGYVPTDLDIEESATFMNGLNWPTTRRHVTAFNEVNAAEYWGNRIDPEDVAQKLNKFVDAFKGKNSNFFVMNGALNASARTGSVLTNLGVHTEYLDEPDFLVRMNNAVPGIFKKLDGWAVHTYPQPEYRGKPLDTTIAGEAAWERGRNTMSSYKWEQNILRTKFGVDLPIFITESGWPHKEGARERSEWLDANTVAEYYKIVFRDLYLKDNSVVAVTPFGIKVPGLDNFSFVGNDGHRYPQFDALKSLPKVAGNPPR